MTHDSTWLEKAHIPRGIRWTAPLGLLLACALLALAPTAAFAAAPEMRGEWELVLESGGQVLNGKTLIVEAADISGKFASQQVQFEHGLSGTFSGTLKGGEAEVTITTSATPLGSGKFESSTMTVEAGVSTLALSGPGTFTLGQNTASGTLVATRIKTQQQIEEQQAREKREQEEREARTNVRGEWALTLEAGPQKLKGIAVIADPANTNNEFASKSTLFEGVLGGTFTGTLKGGQASVMVTTEGNAALSLPPGTFTSNTISVSTSANPASMSGSGTFKFGSTEVPGTLTATRLRTHAQVEAREIAERQAKEKLEEEAKIAKEKAEREAQEKAELQAKEKLEREAREAREALEKAAKVLTPPPPSSLVSPVILGAKSLTVSSTGGLLLKLTNPNSEPVNGHLKVTLAKAGKASSAKHTKSKGATLGEASFSIAGKGSEVVKITLSHSARTELAHLKTMHVLLTVTMQASGQATTARLYSLTLHPHHKG
jgi:hypothetical protein